LEISSTWGAAETPMEGEKVSRLEEVPNNNDVPELG